MDTHILALQLMVVQGLLGAFDTFYHHEVTESLPRRQTAKLELTIHAFRAFIYSILFISLSAWTWQGAAGNFIIALCVFEIALTLWDFVLEDKTRLLPASERVTHTLLALNYGAFIALLALSLRQWLDMPAEIVWAPQGYLSVLLVLCGLGAALSGLRDAYAVCQLVVRVTPTTSGDAVHFHHQRLQVLVTGATGFIGKQLVRALLKDGHQVMVITRRPKHAAWIFDAKVTCFSSLRELPHDCCVDVIINLAGERILGQRWTQHRKNSLLRSRVDITNAINEWIANAAQKPRLFLSASAIGYYGIQAMGSSDSLDEASQPQAIFMSELCQLWEKAAANATQYGVPVVRLRLGLVLGAEGALPRMLLPIRLGLGGPLGSGQQCLSWIHVHDVIRAMAFICQQHLSTQPMQASATAYNLTAPQHVAQRDFCRLAAQRLHRPCWMRTPAWLIRLLLGEQADLLLEGQRVKASALKEQGFKWKFPDLDGALKNLL
jgi:uncharacterized protein (TIGR01777 family)